jgi:hypothetical protein
MKIFPGKRRDNGISFLPLPLPIRAPLLFRETLYEYVGVSHKRFKVLSGLRTNRFKNNLNLVKKRTERTLPASSTKAYVPNRRFLGFENVDQDQPSRFFNVKEIKEFRDLLILLHSQFSEYTKQTLSLYKLNKYQKIAKIPILSVQTIVFQQSLVNRRRH